MLAVTRKEQSWAACDFQIELELHSAATGALIAAAPVITWSETPSCDEKSDKKSGGMTARARESVAKRAAKLQTLVDLGFVTTSVERGSAIESVETHGRYPKQKTSFKQRKIGLVVADRTARVLAGNSELGSAKVLDTLRAAVYVPDASAMIVWSLHPAGDVCESTDPTFVTVLPIKAAPAGPRPR